MLELDQKTIKRYRRYLAEERMEADTYRSLSRNRVGVEREILLALSQAEERHERYWLKVLGDHALPAPKAPLAARILNTFTRWFGSIFVLAMMQRAEQRSEYDSDQGVPAAMAADEHIHGEVVRGLAERQRLSMSGTFRAAVFGINDGLVSTCALILGVVGVSTGSRGAIIATGIAGLLAGALSMAAGEYISVHSQTELLAASNPDPDSQNAIAKLDMNENELALVFRARGDSDEVAQQKAIAALKGLESEALSHNVEHEAVGTGTKAAWGSFIAFATGAFIPILPFLFPVAVWNATLMSIALVGVSLFVIGGAVGLLSGSAPFPKGIRQLLIGYGAALITFCMGLGLNYFGLNI